MIKLSKDSILNFQNLLDKKTLQNIQEVLSGNNFEWYWNETTLGTEEYIEGDTPQFTHSFMTNRIVNSTRIELVQPILIAVQDRIEQKFIPGRIKANLLYPIGKHHTHPAHHDEPQTDENMFYSFIFYPFNCDGDTILYNQFYEDTQTDKKNIVLKNTPHENSCIFFNSSRLHASSNPINFTRRVVLNFVVSLY